MDIHVWRVWCDAHDWILFPACLLTFVLSGGIFCLTWWAIARWVTTYKQLAVFCFLNIVVFFSADIGGCFVLDAYKIEPLSTSRSLVVLFVLMPLFAPILGCWAASYEVRDKYRHSFYGNDDKPMPEEPPAPSSDQLVSPDSDDV